MDAQFRNTDLTIKAYGYMGMKAEMERIPPLQMGRLYDFIWYGVEQARNAAQIQQQIALVNVMRGTPPQMLPGRQLNLVPLYEQVSAATFGPRIAPLIFEDMSKKFTYPPEMENKILAEGHWWPTSPQDDDAQHMEVHHEEEQKTGDPTGRIKQHIAMHRMQQIKRALEQQAQMQGQPGTPGGAGRGIAGTPRQGAQPAAPRQNKGPPGMIPPDQLARAGAPQPPRR
jgi:hypothetical protein